MTMKEMFFNRTLVVLRFLAELCLQLLVPVPMVPVDQQDDDDHDQDHGSG